MKNLLAISAVFMAALGTVWAQPPAQVLPDTITVPSGEYIPTLTVYDPPENWEPPVEYHLEPWVAAIKSHYADLQAFAKIEDLRDDQGNCVEWHPPMTTFMR